jgi:aryl-alcohol dehydrogenase-like predicted oxidoreductase
MEYRFLGKAGLNKGLGVTAPIIGVRTLAPLEANLGATDWALGKDQIERLNSASDKPLPYPNNFLRHAGRR